jgi:hypothetical protein
VIYFADSPGAFLGTRPDWTLDEASVEWLDGSVVRLSQEPFRWARGVWETEVVVTHPGAAATQLLIRIEPITLRRWKEIGINPVVEAWAQLRDHLRRASGKGASSLLTLL